MNEDQIIARVQQKIPDAMCVTTKTTPIVYFGQYEEAKACTISLNPSDREFNDNKGNTLIGNRERLCSRAKLKVDDNQPLSREEAIQVLSNCRTYFSRNPYRLWFDKYEKFLNCFDYSYYDGSCVHLDLIQWATTPFWGTLSNEIKKNLLTQDLPFLKGLLEKDFEYVFLNGSTVVNEVRGCLQIELEEGFVKLNNKNMTVYKGAYDKAIVLGWSWYLQSAMVGGYENIKRVAEIVKAQL